MLVCIPVMSKDLKELPSKVFARAEYFMIYNTDTKEAKYLDNAAKDLSGGAGSKASQAIIDQNVDALICYRLGENAFDVLGLSSVEVYRAEDLSVAELIVEFENKSLTILDVRSTSKHGH